MTNQRCALIVDRFNIEFSLQDLSGTDEATRLDLVRLVRWLHLVGIEPAEVMLAGPAVMFTEGIADMKKARRWAEGHRRWLRGASSAITEAFPGVTVRHLIGATDGHGEVAVDVTVAAGALDAAARADTDGFELIVVASVDTDFYGLHEYAAPVPLFVTGYFDGGHRDRLESMNTPSIQIPRDDFVGFASSAPDDVVSSLRRTAAGDARVPKSVVGVLTDDEVLIECDGDKYVRSSPLRRPVVAEPPLATGVVGDCRTVVVVDPYGMMNTAVAAVGAADLPSIEQTEALIEWLGWDWPMALLARIPDVEEDPLRKLDAPRRNAWTARDAELDALAAAYDGDGEDRTVVRRGRLNANRVTQLGAGEVDRFRPLRAAKGLAVGLIADLWVACRHAPDSDVVLVSDHADIAVALHLLEHSGLHGYEHVVWVGVHPVVDLDLVSGLEPVTPPFVMMVDAQLARLCGSPEGVFGARHRRALTRAIDTGAEIVADGLDPETGASSVIVRIGVDIDGDGIPDVEELEAIAFGGDAPVRSLARGAPMPEQLPSDPNRRLTITFDRHSPCAHPVLMYRTDQSRRVDAVVVDQDGNWILVDVDGDGVADHRVPVGHQAVDFEPGDSVTIVEEAGRRNLVDPQGASTEEIDPEIVVVTGFSVGVGTPGGGLEGLETHWEARSLDDPTCTGRLVTTHGDPCPYADHANGGTVHYAVRRNGAAGIEFVATSTHLEHLRRMIP